MRSPAALAVAALLALASPALAVTRVLTFGGGPSPMLDQLSLETNVGYFREALATLGHAGWRHDVYFADAGVGERAVQYLAPRTEALAFRERLANLFTSESRADAPLDVRYRRVALAGVAGPSTGAALTRGIEASGRSLAAGDRLLFYFTGHGSPDRAGGAAPRNTVMDMWGSPSVSVRDFAAELDKLDPSADVLIVMVQCYSGGFANVIYAGGDPARGLSKQSRLGLFSTTASRMAAGCTSDVRGDDYREFSTAFFAALCGRTRGGAATDQPDYDGDGRTTIAEAFAAVQSSLDTIDVPMTTADQLLRDRSRFAAPPTSRPTAPSTNPAMRAATRRAATRPAAPGDLLPADLPFAKVHAMATPVERAMLDALVASLELRDAADPLVECRARRRAIESERAALRDESSRNAKAYGEAKEACRRALLQRWPELAMPWLPDAADAMTNRLDAIRADLLALPEFASYTAASDRARASGERGQALERRWAKSTRLLERAASIILASNLPKVADAESVDYFLQLQARLNEPL